MLIGRYMIVQRKKLNIQINRLKLAKLCRKCGITLVVLHGSYTRGYFTKESDVDVGFLGNARKIKGRYFKVISKLGELFGDKFDPVFLNNAETMIVRQVALYGIPLYEKKKGLFNAFRTTAISRYQDAVKFRRLEELYLQRNI